MTAAAAAGAAVILAIEAAVVHMGTCLPSETHATAQPPTPPQSDSRGRFVGLGTGRGGLYFGAGQLHARLCEVDHVDEEHRRLPPARLSNARRSSEAKGA